MKEKSANQRLYEAFEKMKMIKRRAYKCSGMYKSYKDHVSEKINEIRVNSTKEQPKILNDFEKEYAAFIEQQKEILIQRKFEEEQAKHAAEMSQEVKDNKAKETENLEAFIAATNKSESVEEPVKKRRRRKKIAG